MKRRDLIRKIEEAGAIFIRHGGKHDWYQNSQTKVAQPVPRHSEINEMLARGILRKLSSKQAATRRKLEQR